MLVSGGFESPAAGTSSLFYAVLYPLKTRMAYRSVGFLLSYAISGSIMKYQQIDGICVGIFQSLKMRYQHRGRNGAYRHFHPAGQIQRHGGWR